MRGELIREKLHRGERVYGTHVCSLGNPLAAKMATQLELDFAFICNEHMPIGRTETSMMCMFYAAHGISPSCGGCAATSTSGTAAPAERSRPASAEATSFRRGRARLVRSNRNGKAEGWVEPAIRGYTDRIRRVAPGLLRR